MIRTASFFGTAKSCGTVRLIKYTPVGLWRRLACLRELLSVSRVARILLLVKSSCVLGHTGALGSKGRFSVSLASPS